MKRIVLLALLFVCVALPVMAEPCTVGVACPFGLQQLTVEIGTAEMLDSFANPVEVIPAPGAGFAVVPMHVVSLLGTGPAYDEDAALKWEGHASSIATVTLDTASSFEAGPATARNGALSEFENQAILFAGVDGIDVSATGSIVSITNSSGGLNYEVGDTGTIDDGTGATYLVDAVDAGEITALTLTAGGSGYRVATGVGTTATSGTGESLIVNIDSISASNATASITVVYSVIEVP